MGVTRRMQHRQGIDNTARSNVDLPKPNQTPTRYTLAKHTIYWVWVVTAGFLLRLRHIFAIGFDYLSCLHDDEGCAYVCMIPPSVVNHSPTSQHASRVIQHILCFIGPSPPLITYMMRAESCDAYHNLWRAEARKLRRRRWCRCAVPMP